MYPGRGRSCPRFSFRPTLPQRPAAIQPSQPLVPEPSPSTPKIDDAPIIERQQPVISAAQDLEVPEVVETPRRIHVPSNFRINIREYPKSEPLPIIRSNEIEPGEIGRRIELIANYMKVNCESKIIHKYDLDFKFKKFIDNVGDKIAPEDNEAMQKFFARILPKLAQIFIDLNSNTFDRLADKYIYDNGYNIYSLQEIDTNTMNKEFELQVNNRQKMITVDISKVQTIDLAEISMYYSGRLPKISAVTLQFFEILIQNICLKQFELYRRNLYDASNELSMIKSSQKWLKFVRGFTTSIARTQFGPSLNLHLKTTCMISNDIDTLLQLVLYISNVSDIRSLSANDFPKVNKIIKGLQVFTQYRGSKIIHKIKCLTPRKPNEIEFTIKDKNGEKIMSVAEYFDERYNIRLKDYPTVQLIGPANLYVPLELLMMVDRQFLSQSKIDPAIQNDLLFASTNKPLAYFNYVTKFTNDLADINPVKMGNFGMDIVPKPVNFFGRLLVAPECVGNRNQNDRFVSPISFEWIFISFDDRFTMYDMENFAQKLKSIGSRFGLRFERCLKKLVVQIDQRRLAEVPRIFSNLIDEFYDDNNLLILIALPQTKYLYETIKQIGDQKFGIITQCLKSIKAKKSPRGYIENLLLKINGKLGGKNSHIHPRDLESFDFDCRKTMIIGIDVNHPGHNESIQCSIACAIGSLDDYFTKYTASIMAQTQQRKEIITTLDQMINELLDEYNGCNNYYPSNFIVFRDGLGDGQLELANEEISLINKAIRNKVKNGKLIYMVVIKRHGTRFAPTTPLGSPDRPVYNVPAGTVVDHTITDPSYCMFYLNSHNSPLGTSRPSKYIILHNDFGRKQINMDTIEKFCYYLCHNCIRCRGSISIPIPVYYADLCAYRSKLHLEAQYALSGVPFENLQEFENVVITKLNRLVKIDEKIKNKLYYC
uniref:Argonaute-2-like protein n=1 Tax=Psoroptes ovis TaxID=83912 RepID=A0A3B0QP17_PSOOV|nr:argonaute-2-like protein [Psoroptes ovis]